MARASQRNTSSPKLTTPYMLDQYTVSSHIMGEINGISSPAARIQNCLIRQLDKCQTLPRFIVFVPDNDIIKSSTIDFYDYSTRKMCDEITKWMAEDFINKISKRKSELLKVKGGAVLPGEPKIIFIKMIYRLKKDEVQAVRNHFNAALENSLVEKLNVFIMSINLPSSCFDHTNCLTAQGQLEFWRNFDGQMRRFDNSDFSKRLHSIKQDPATNQNKQNTNNEERYRLPPPPPSRGFSMNKKV